ncbi:hypothetical protein D3C84_1071000 [compost metagenome]
MAQFADLLGQMGDARLDLRDRGTELADLADHEVARRVLRGALLRRAGRPGQAHADRDACRERDHRKDNSAEHRHRQRRTVRDEANRPAAEVASCAKEKWKLHQVGIKGLGLVLFSAVRM